MAGNSWFSVGNDELERCVEAGTHALCPHCGTLRMIEWGDAVKDNGELVPSRLLGFVKCGKSSYLVAVNGKALGGAKV